MLPGDASPFKPLPNKASFRVAVRRCTRVGKRSGVLVEDLGVVPDKDVGVHLMTRRDVLNENVDLINRAGEILAAMPVYAVTAEVRTEGNQKRVDVTSKNVTRLDAFLNSRPYRSLDVQDGVSPIDLPLLPAGTLELRGFRGDKLVASTRVRL